MFMNRITDPQQAATVFLEAIRQSRCAVALTGAGVSTGSGIPDFRGAGGLYSKISPQTFEIDFFMSRPADYYKIAIEHIHPLVDKDPNPAHFMLARLEEQGLLKALITQNIDGLHSKAGSKNVIEFHGDVVHFFCTECEKPFDRPFVDQKIRLEAVPKCDQCGGLIQPGIVFFGDLIPLEALYAARKYTLTADLFIALGSSLEVNPAASLALEAYRAGARLIIVNRGPTHLDSAASDRYEVDLTDFSKAVLRAL
jgi:NAD-dependent deacetylase